MPRSKPGFDTSATRTPLATLKYYPTYMHEAHPLHHLWVKLPASLIKKLHVPPGWESSHPELGRPGAGSLRSAAVSPLFHYLNHPLPYIQICGIVVDVKHLPKKLAWVVQVDDSSGELANVLINKFVDPNAPRLPSSKIGSVQQGESLQPGDIIPNQVPDWLACSFVTGEKFDIRSIEIGVILRAKGRLSPWEKGRQLLMEKFDVFQSTSQEIEFWNVMSEDFNDVLRKPWTLTAQEEETLQNDHQQKREENDKRTRRLHRQASKGWKSKRLAIESSKGKQPLNAPNVPSDIEQHRRMITCLQDVDFPDGPRKQDGLFPSYQVPTNESNESSLSSNNERQSQVKESSNASSEGVLKDVHIQNTKRQKTSRELESPEVMKPKRKSLNSIAQPELQEMGSPSQWNQLDLDGNSSLRSILTGTAWVEVRNEMRPERRRMRESMGIQHQASKQTSSLIQEWDELDL